MYRLRIELLTPVCPGAGIGRPGYVDREICFDTQGLPYLPGKRIRGLLRDGYEQVGSALALPAPTHRLLFGRIGDSIPGALGVGTARLSGAGKLAAWLRAAMKAAPGIAREEIMDEFTEIRRQTKIDPETGAPQQNTLRATRILRRGLVFHARVDGVLPETEQVLALAAAAIQTMGTSRNRGLGHVSCRLEEVETLDDAKARRDVGKEAIDKVAPGGFAVNVPEEPKSRPSVVTDTATISRTAPVAVLRFRVTLREPALMPQLGGDPNLISTHRHITGSTIRGLFAASYLTRNGSADAAFHDLITSGNVTFLGAHPELKGHPGRDPSRSVAIPMCVRKEKPPPEGDRKHLNLAYYTGDSTTKREGGWCLLDEAFAGSSYKVEPKTEMQYHHARPSDRRVGHVVGAEQRGEYGMEPTQAGAFFTYESLQQGQVFIGAVLGDKARLEQVRGLVSHKDTVRIGRSRSSQYGGHAHWEWLDDTPLSISTGGGEATGWNGDEERRSPTKKLIVTLLSPMVTRNEHGHFAPCFPKAEFEQAGLKDLHIDKTFGRGVGWGGYLSHQGLPRQQILGLDAGTVFIVSLAQSCGLEQIAAAEALSYGERTAEGFGRVSIKAWAQRDDPRVKLELEPSSELRSVLVSPGSAQAQIAERLFQRRMLQGIRAKAMEWAEDTKGKDAVTNAFTHRLLETLRSTPLDKLGEELGKYRKKAMQQLERPLITRTKKKPSTLKDHLIGVAASRHQEFAEISKWVYETTNEGWMDIFRTNPLMNGNEPADKAFADSAIRALLVRYVEVMSLSNRAVRAAAGGRR